MRKSRMYAMLCQLVPSSAILTTCFHTAVPRSNAVEDFLLMLHLGARSFEHECAGNHLLGIEALHLGDEESLDATLELAQSVGFRLQGQAKLKLKVVHKPHAGRRRSFASHFVHELVAILKRRKQHRTVLLRFWKGKHFDDRRCDDSESSFRTEDQPSQIHAYRLAGRATRT